MYGVHQTALAFANELIAIGVGVALISWAGNSKKLALAKITGYFIAVLAFLALLYTAYCGSAMTFSKSKHMSNGKTCHHKADSYKNKARHS